MEFRQAPSLLSRLPWSSKGALLQCARGSSAARCSQARALFSGGDSGAHIGWQEGDRADCCGRPSVVVRPPAVVLGRTKSSRSLPTSERWVDGDGPDEGRDHPGPQAGILFWVVNGEGLAERRLPERIRAYEAGGRQPGRWVLAVDLRPGDESCCGTAKSRRWTRGGGRYGGNGLQFPSV